MLKVLLKVKKVNEFVYIFELLALSVSAALPIGTGGGALARAKLRYLN
jgi:hypothetical protein